MERVPEGPSDNSPAFQRRVSVHKKVNRVPEARLRRMAQAFDLT